MSSLNYKMEMDKIPIVENIHFGHTLSPMVTFPIGGTVKLLREGNDRTIKSPITKFQNLFQLFALIKLLKL